MPSAISSTGIFARNRSRQIVAVKNSPVRRQASTSASSRNRDRHAIIPCMPFQHQAVSQSQREYLLLRSLRAHEFARDRPCASPQSGRSCPEFPAVPMISSQSPCPAPPDSITMLVNLRFRANVHALRGLVENQHLRGRWPATAPAPLSADCRRKARLPPHRRTASSCAAAPRKLRAKRIFPAPIDQPVLARRPPDRPA